MPGRGAYLFLPAVRPDGDRHGSKGPANRLLQRRLPHTVVFRASEADTVGRYDKKRVRTDELRSDSFCIYNNVIYRSDRRLDEAARVCQDKHEKRDASRQTVSPILYCKIAAIRIGALGGGYFCVCCNTMINTIKSNNVTFTWAISICNTLFLGA